MIAFFGFATACSQGSGTEVGCVKLLWVPALSRYCLRPGFMIFLRFFVGIGRPRLVRALRRQQLAWAGCGIGFPAAYSLMPEATEHAVFVQM